MKKKSKKSKKNQKSIKRQKPKSSKRYPFKVGDSVVVKPGVKDFDFGDDISGWQGRVTEFMETKEYGTTVMVAWDSITLLNEPESMLIKCNEKGLSWAEMNLALNEVERTTSRDTLKDVSGQACPCRSCQNPSREEMPIFLALDWARRGRN